MSIKELETFGKEASEIIKNINELLANKDIPVLNVIEIKRDYDLLIESFKVIKTNLQSIDDLNSEYAILEKGFKTD